jgi:hypothetical protein
LQTAESQSWRHRTRSSTTLITTKWTNMRTK